MNKKLLISSLGVISALTIAACVSNTKHGDREVAASAFTENSTQFADQRRARDLDDKLVRTWSTQSGMQLESARVIKDNDLSFQSKLDTIKSARSTIRMVYFIYAEDDSSSAISQALVERAQAGVRVKLLVDFITNYSHFDHFRMMEREGRGNLSVHYYNFPGATILEDAKYIVLPCPPKKANMTEAEKANPAFAKECATFKAPLMAQLKGQETTASSRMLLSGLYGRSGIAGKIAMGYGAQINPDDYKSEQPMSAEDKTHLFDFLKLMKDAAGGDLGAKIKLSVAMNTYGALLNPIMNEVTGRFPVATGSATADNAKSAIWDHLTDYTHHKLLVVDGTYFQLGGRNIEDSYHMKSRITIPGRPAKGKYIFMDTDFWAQAKGGSLKTMEESFDKLISAGGLVADSKRVEQVIPNEFSQNTARESKTSQIPSAAEMAVGKCLAQAKAGQITDINACAEAGVVSEANYKSLDVRMNAALENMNKSAEIFATKYTAVPRDSFKDEAWRPGIDNLSANDLKNAQFNYIENVSYDRRTSQRNTGSFVGAEGKFNKNIHALWYRGIENACYVSRKQNRDQRVIIHSAYLFMPMGLTHKIAKMLNGDYGDCSKVHFTFLTNSFETTDLNVVNIFALYQMRELFKLYATKANLPQPHYHPKMDYFEYNATSGAGTSLHTKASVLGDDIIIGSANADLRSYYMDTNNGIFIRNAKDLVNDYTQYINRLTSDKKATTEWTNVLPTISDEQIDKQNAVILACMAAKYDKKGRVSELASRPADCTKSLPKFTVRGQRFLQEVKETGARIAYDTQQILNFRQEFDRIMLNGGDGLSAEEMRLNKIANDFDKYFKTL